MSCMISIYHYLVEFFLDVPTFRSVVSRSLKIFFVGIFMLVVCMATQVPFEYAFVIYSLIIILPGFISSQYARQKFGSKRM